MNYANSTASTSAINDVVSEKDQCAPDVIVDFETTCWGCGLPVLVSPHASVFKCGWCGAITKQNIVKGCNKYIQWRRFRDWCFVGVVLLFMLFFISFRPASVSPTIIWGSYPTVGKSGLEKNYTFCPYCSKPKSHRAHHCRSCGMCILDMDHHCPFIGNCVGAANHRSFILFLISAVTSTFYVAIMSSFASLCIWPPLNHRPVSQFSGFVNTELLFRVLKEQVLAILTSAMFLPARGLVLVYLFISSVSVGIGLSVLLWQQLCYIYAGNTYLSNLSSMDSDGRTDGDCQNLVNFFGCPFGAAIYLRSCWKSGKSHKK